MNTQETIQDAIGDPPNVELPKSAPGKINGVKYPQTFKAFEDIIGPTRAVACGIAFGDNANPPPGSILA